MPSVRKIIGLEKIAHRRSHHILQNSEKIGKIQENSIETGWRSRRNRKK
jgi:hypothetical protein